MEGYITLEVPWVDGSMPTLCVFKIETPNMKSVYILCLYKLVTTIEPNLIIIKFLAL